MKKSISIVFCVVLFFLFNISLLVFCVSRLTSINFVNSVVDDVDVVDTIHSMRQSDNGEISGVIDDLYKKAENHGFNEEQVDNIIGSDMTKELIEKYASNMFDSGKSLTEDDINTIVENNVDEIIDSSNGALKKEDRGEILKATETIAPTIADNLPDSNKILKSTDGDIDLSVNNKKNNSNYGYLIYIISAVLVLGMIIFLQNKKFKWLLYTGVTILISSIISLISILLGRGLINLLISEDKLLNNVVSPIVSNICNPVYITLSICLVVSVIELVVYNILKSKNIKSKKSEI